MDTIQRQSIDQNLLKLAETSGFSDIWAQDYSGYFEDIKDYIYIYLNGEKQKTTRYITDKYFQLRNFEKQNSCLSRMALLHLRKIDFIIRNVILSWIFFSLYKKESTIHAQYTHK